MVDDLEPLEGDSRLLIKLNSDGAPDQAIVRDYDIPGAHILANLRAPGAHIADV